MLNFLLIKFVKFCLALRYRIRVRGLDKIAAKGTGGILFLPNHPALIDPIIMQSILQPVFRVRALADREQIDRFFVRWLARRVNVIPILDPARANEENRQVIQAGLDECAKVLRAGQNVLLYPAGHIYTTRHEHLRGNSGVEILLQQVPQARVVLVRQTGLWGSAFSRAGDGTMPSVAHVLAEGLPDLIVSGLLYAPKRSVDVEFVEPADLPRGTGRNLLNEYLKNFYNAKAPPNTYVPRTIWEGGRPVAVPESAAHQISGDSAGVPQATRRIVLDYLKQLTDRTDIADRMNLAADLGLDSLDRGDLLIWMENELGNPQGDVESINTVGDLILAACGAAISSAPADIKPVPRKWLAAGVRTRRADGKDRQRVAVAPGSTIAESFLAQAAQSPGRVIVADQMRGTLTYRDLITAITVLRPLIEKLPGEHLGIMLPASCAAATLYLAAMFAGKTPVMVNWTVGQRNLLHCLDHVNCRSVVTAGAMVRRLADQGMDLSGVKDRLVELESLAGGISTWTKLRAAAAARLSWASLRSASVSPTAAILFTSGSETFPKAVPLSHVNILTN
ncbi:MAG: AMP-binding protein, partial [Planctomycetes bacterium]|nr:AMP-binding protein [Planctomycetota bacterium]